MGKHFVTFGQQHAHSVNGKTFDKDSVAVIDANSWEEGREKAFGYFGDKFGTSYHDTEWDERNMKYFPRGYINVDRSEWTPKPKNQ